MKRRRKNTAQKKVHRLKNNVVGDDNQRIHYLSPTEPGRMHDKKIADAYPLQLPVGSVLGQAPGFMGHHPEGGLVEMPHKKPKNGTLEFSQLLYNQMLILPYGSSLSMSTVASSAYA